MKKFIMIICLLQFGELYAQKTIYRKNGVYNISVQTNIFPNEPIVFGYIKDYGNNLSVIVPKLKIDKGKYLDIDLKTGYYRYNVSSGKHSISAFGMGFKTVSTKKIKFNKGDSVRIDFYLKPDTILLDNKSKFN